MLYTFIVYSKIIGEPEKDEIEIIGLLDPLSELVPTKIFHFESSTRHSHIGADSKIPIYHLAIYGCLTGSKGGCMKMYCKSLELLPICNFCGIFLILFLFKEN